MPNPTPDVRNISDTALWVAYFRAMETKRPDALFSDPFAERLAGERGFQLANSLADGNKHEWAWVARTYLFDKFIREELQQGADMVVNLAAGLDTRPYRMDVPETLHWIEVDFPAIIDYKAEILSSDRPKCRLERVALDLSDIEARRSLFARLNQQARRIVVVTEGLLIYFADEEVAAFGKDLRICSNFRSWIIDLTSPGQLRTMQRSTGKQLSEAGAAFKFAPPEGVDFFTRYGWTPRDVQGFLKTAAQLNRAPAALLALLPEPKGAPGNYPWTGVCLLERSSD